MKHAANVAVPVVEETGIKQDTTNITEILKHTVPPKKAEPIVTVWTANHIEAPKPNPLYVNIKSRLFDAKSKKEIVEPEPVKFEYPPKESLSKYEQALYSVLVKEESDTYSSIINSKKEFPIEAWSDFDNIWDIELQNNEERLGTSYSCHAPYTAIEYNGGYTKYPKVSNKAYTEKSVKSTGNIKIRPMNFSRPNLPQPEKKQNDNQKMIQISLVPKAIESESLLSSLDSCFTEQPTEVEKKDLSISPKRFSHKNKRPELLSWKQERQNLNSIGELARVLKPRVRTPPKYQISSFKKDASVNLNEEMDRYDDFQRVRFTSKVLDRNNGRILVPNH